MNGELPSSWERVQLGQICLPRTGKVIPASDDNRPYLSFDNIACDRGTITVWEKASDYGSQSVELYPEDVAYVRLRPYLNKVAHIDCVALGSAELIVFPESEAVLPRYLQYLLLSPSFCKFAQHESTGDRPRLKWRQMQEYELPLPPACEQKRIVVAIEEHFSRLEAVDSALEVAQLRSAQLLESALQAAIRHYPTQDASLASLLTQKLSNGRSVPTAHSDGLPVLRLTCLQSGPCLWH